MVQQCMCVRMQNLDPVAVGPVQHSLLRGILIGQGWGGGRGRGRRGRGVPRTGSTADQFHAAVVAGLLGGQRQVEQVRQRCDVVQVTEGGAGAPAAVGPAQTLLAPLPTTDTVLFV